MMRMTIKLMALATAVLMLNINALAADINVTYANGVQRYLPSMNSNEQVREEHFRENVINSETRFNTLFTFNKERLEGTDWAGERLVESADDYTVDYFLKRLIEDNMSRFSNADDIDRIDINVERIRVANYAISRIGSAGTYVKATASWRGKDGELGGSTKLTANLLNIPALDKPYTGEKYAFGEPDRANRVGPTLSYFVEQMLINLFPEEKDQIHGPIFVSFKGALGGRIASN